jgi:uncharacterized protein (UPF0261 family)
MRGFSFYDQVGGPFHDEAADRAFVDGLRTELDGRIRVDERDEHINDPEFADAVIAAFERVVARSDGRRAVDADAGVAGGGAWS